MTINESSMFAEWSASELPRAIERLVQVASKLKPSECEHWTEVRGDALVRSKASLGMFAEAQWRSFVVSLLAADWACYSTDVDRVDFERLAFAASVFPDGFRLFTVPTEKHGEVPVGYSGWFPTTRGCFELLRDHSRDLVDRTVIPVRKVHAGCSDVYLFNYSVVPQLRGTALSRALVRGFASDVWSAAPRSLTAITVSPDGQRIAERFGASIRGQLTIDGEAEDVLVWERG